MTSRERTKRRGWKLEWTPDEGNSSLLQTLWFTRYYSTNQSLRWSSKLICDLGHKARIQSFHFNRVLKVPYIPRWISCLHLVSISKAIWESFWTFWTYYFILLHTGSFLDMRVHYDISIRLSAMGFPFRQIGSPLFPSKQKLTHYIYSLFSLLSKVTHLFFVLIDMNLRAT